MDNSSRKWRRDLDSAIVHTVPQSGTMGQEMFKGLVVAILKDQVDVYPNLGICDVDCYVNVLTEAQAIASSMRKKYGDSLSRYLD